MIAFTLMLMTIIFTTSCNTYRLRNNTIIQEIKNITLNSYDPYGQLTSYILEELHIKKITVVESYNFDSNYLPSLRIVNASESKVTTSVFQDGKVAEYRIILTMQAQILMPSKDYYYPFDIQVYRSLFDNKLSALAKDTEEDFIRHEMHKQAAHQLVSKLLNILLLAADNKIYKNSK